MSIKLIKACKELNIGMSAAVTFCASLGKEINADPNVRIDDDLYLLLAKEFNKDMALKLEAEQGYKGSETTPISATPQNNDTKMEYTRQRALTIGQIVVGTVSNIVEYGVFVKFSDNKSGLLHISEMSWRRISNPSDIVTKGQEIRVMIKDIDSQGRILLSLKRVAETLSKQLTESVYITITGFDDNHKLVTADYNHCPAVIKKEHLSVNKVRNMQEEVFVGEQLKAKCIGLYNSDTLEFSLKELCADIYDQSLYKKTLLELLDLMGIHTNEFIAKANNTGSQAVLTNIAVIDGENDDRGRLLVDPITGKNISIWIPNDQTQYADGYYQITLGLASEQYRFRSRDPFIFCIHSVIKEIPNNPYKAAVELAYAKHTSPATNQSVARLLDEVGENLYSSKKRMFFELLQNADDSSALDGVKFNVEITNEYLIVTHNGLSFNAEDFESIISAAKSTKRANLKKTGYKGIGFKSVFTGTQKVLIKTGGLFFSFDSTYAEYNNFDKFYFNVNNIKTEEDREIFLKKYRDNKKEFGGVKDIPWQLLPIWENSIPEELRNTSFRQTANVAIAIKKSPIDIQEVDESINKVLLEPLFLLFLRNTKRVQLLHNKQIITIQKEYREGKTEIISSYNSTKRLFDVRNNDDIPVSDDAFQTCHISIRKNQELIPGQDEKEDILEQFDSVTGSHKKVEVPNRIAASTMTTISYAIPLNQKGQIQPISTNVGNTVFAYLPMNQMSYCFRFYINADFIPTSDREGVQTNNPWNWYLFYQIGTRIPKWVSESASVNNSEYLNLLQSQLFAADDELSHHFNRGYLESIENVPFILDEYGHLAKQEDIIIDKSGLSDIIGSDLFRYILNTQRRLPNRQINTEILEQSKDTNGDKLFNKIEIINAPKVCSLLVENESIQNWLRTAEKECQDTFFQWIAKNGKDCDGLISSLPILKCGTEMLTLAELTSRPQYILLTEHIAPLRAILSKLGFTCTEDVISKHPLFDLIDVPTDKSVFDRINTKCPFTELSATEKRNLVLRLLEFDGVGKTTIQSMCIFRNKLGNVTPLDSLVKTEKSYLCNFAICDEDYNEELDKLLLQDSDVYDKLLCTSYKFNIFNNDNVVEIYNDYHNDWTQPFWKELVKSLPVKAMLPIMHNANSEIVAEYLKQVPDIQLDKDIYLEQDFEYGVYKLANNPHNTKILLEKTYIDGELVSNYTIKDDITIVIEDKPYHLLLSEILPSRKTYIATRFERCFPFVHIDLIELGKGRIAEEILQELNTTGKSISPAQFVFICLWNTSRNYTTTYSPFSNEQVESINNHIIECLDYCYAHNIARNLPLFRKQGIVNWNISNKYFDIPNLLLESEILSSDIRIWADTPERVDFLYNLGVKRKDDVIIRTREAFWNGVQYDGDISCDSSNFQWIANLSEKKLSEKDEKRGLRIELLKRMLEKTNRSFERKNVELCRKYAKEWSGTEIYAEWKNERSRRIFVCPQGVPYELYYGEYTFCTLFDDKPFCYNNDIYVSERLDIQDAMNDVVSKYGQTFTRDDWYRLFMISNKDYHNLEEERNHLEEENRHLREENQRLKENYRYSTEFGAGTDAPINKNEQIEAQREAQRFLKQMKLGIWKFESNYGELDDAGRLCHFSTSTIEDGDGNKMFIVLKSYKYQDEPFKINPEEWDYIFQKNAHLLIYTNNDIVEMSKEDILQNQSNITLSFSTQNLQIEDKVQELSNILHFFKDIHFDFASFNITERAQSIRNMYNKHEGTQCHTGDDDL